jgi:hypothetical protein
MQKLKQSESTSQSAPHLSEQMLVQLPFAQVKGLQLIAEISLQKFTHPFDPSHLNCLCLAEHSSLQAKPETMHPTSELQTPSWQAVSAGQ